MTRQTSRPIIAAALFAALLSAAAQAEDRLVVHQVSYHFDRSQGYRETNPGLGWQRTVQSGGYWQAGAYLNSVNRRTVYVVRGADFWQAGPVAIGAFAGVGTGYRKQWVQRRVYFKTPAPPCNDPNGCPPWPDSSDLVTVRQPRGGVSPLAGVTFSADAGPARLHLVLTPTVRYSGQVQNHGAAALLVSFAL